ncbi:MAG: ABC transporter permease [Clostridia bacterium]|nr:ABC transporter permease [Clostridia bacterium]
MVRYIVRRFLLSVVAFWAIATLTFILMHSIPGDPFTDPKLPEPIHQLMLHKYGLDKPLYEQYLIYLNNLLHFDLGDSLRFRDQSVNRMIRDGFPVSALLGVEALLWSVGLGLFLGLIAALNRNRALDMVTMAIAIIAISVPNFVIAGALQWLFGVKLEILPIARWGGIEYQILPAISLGFGVIGGMARFMRTSVLDVITQDYIRTAKSKGLTAFETVWRHVIRNSLLPIITILGPLIAGITTGTFVVEQIFGIPGLGKYYVNSIYNRDYPLIMGTTLFYAVLLIIMNFLVDVLYGVVDPRIRITGKREA